MKDFEEKATFLGFCFSIPANRPTLKNLLTKVGGGLLSSSPFLTHGTVALPCFHHRAHVQMSQPLQMEEAMEGPTLWCWRL